jgi:hypothetical protein
MSRIDFGFPRFVDFPIAELDRKIGFYPRMLCV